MVSQCSLDVYTENILLKLPLFSLCVGCNTKNICVSICLRFGGVTRALAHSDSVTGL